MMPVANHAVDLNFQVANLSHVMVQVSGRNLTRNHFSAGGQLLSTVTAWAEPDGLTRAEPLELCDEPVAAAGAPRAPRDAAGRPLRSGQDAVSRAPLGLVAGPGPARGRRSARPELPYVPTRQGRPPAPGRSALPVARPDTPGRLHPSQPGLP
jgi:hypothetical protein